MLVSHHVTVFGRLDDIQWMDEGSRQFIDILLHEKDDLKNILIIFVYRDEEVGKVNDLFGKPIDDVVNIPLTNLNYQEVHDMTSALLCFSPTEIPRSFTELVLNRTLGNPFYVIQFLLMLVDEGHVTCQSDDSALWISNVENIQRSIMLPNTMADVLMRKIRRLPENVQHVLMVASLLGFRFSGKTFIDVMVSSSNSANDDWYSNEWTISMGVEDVMASLIQAIEAGIVEKTNDGFQFTHDKLQRCCRDMIAYDEKERLHRVIGETFFAEGDAESKYHAAVHLNQVSRGIRCDEMKMANLNLDAAKYCLQISAFIKAADLLKKGLSFLPDSQMWNEYYELKLQMMQLLSEVELVIGNFEACKTISEQTIENARSKKDKVDSLVILTRVHFLEGRIPHCIRVSNQSLEVLGIHMPYRVSGLQTLLMIRKVRMLFRGKSDENILDILPTTDKVVCGVSRLLALQSACCLLEGKIKQCAYCTLRAAQLTLEHGITPSTAQVFATLAAMECAMGNFDRGYRIANLTLAVVERETYNLSESKAIAIVCLMVVHWRAPLIELTSNADRALKRNFETGESNSAITVAIAIRASIGENLTTLADRCASLTAKLLDYKQHTTIQWLKPVYQFVLNLKCSESCDWYALCELTGDVMDEFVFVRECVASKQHFLLPTVFMYKLQLAYHFGCLSEAEATLKAMEPYVKKYLNLTFHYVYIRFFGALTYYELYRRDGQRKNYHLARWYKRSLDRQEFLRCPNSIPLRVLLSAEDLSVSKRSSMSSLEAAYGKAIQSMADAQLAHLEGLANERAGFICERRGNMGTATDYFLRAYELYSEKWGAVAKVEWLQEAVACKMVFGGELNKTRNCDSELVGSVIEIDTSRPSSRRSLVE